MVNVAFQESGKEDKFETLGNGVSVRRVIIAKKKYTKTIHTTLFSHLFEPAETVNKPYHLFHIPVKTDLISKQTELIDELKNQTMQLEALSGKARADSLVLHSEVTYLREHNDTAKGKLSVKYIRLISRGTLLSLTQ